MTFDCVWKWGPVTKYLQGQITKPHASTHIFSIAKLCVADVVGDYPEELRPERVLNFTDVVAISADKDPRGVEKLKHRVREVLDFYAALQQEDLETKVVATLRAQMNPKGPQMLWMFTLYYAFGENWIKSIHKESNAYVKTYKDLFSLRLFGVDQCLVVLLCDMWQYAYDTSCLCASLSTLPVSWFDHL